MDKLLNDLEKAKVDFKNATTWQQKSVAARKLSKASKKFLNAHFEGLTECRVTLYTVSADETD